MGLQGSLGLCRACVLRHDLIPREEIAAVDAGVECPRPGNGHACPREFHAPAHQVQGHGGKRRERVRQRAKKWRLAVEAQGRRRLIAILKHLLFAVLAGELLHVGIIFVVCRFASLALCFEIRTFL